MVGYRNPEWLTPEQKEDFIRHSDGGVSELRSKRPHRVCATLSGIPMVGYRNKIIEMLERGFDFIRHSDGGVSEQWGFRAASASGLYQAFRWWGIGTPRNRDVLGVKTLSGIPMVGYRNLGGLQPQRGCDFIRHSDGGVSEQAARCLSLLARLYQAFRWWGIGTSKASASALSVTLSGIPMVGYRNLLGALAAGDWDFIRHSDGGVSEPSSHRASPSARLYQAFRWWGIGTY